MKIFISADIEGVATTTLWPETEKGSEDYRLHAQQMTMEVIAACEAASEAGASEIVVRDAHEDGNNLDIWKLPENVTLIRGWSGHPYSMVYGIDPSFDAAIFIGYHSAASSEGNPLSHTESLNPLSVKLNGALASEFLLYSYAAAMEGVPSVFLSGDKSLCETSKGLHPRLITCPVKEGWGGATVNYNPKAVLKWIKEGVKTALNQDLRSALPNLPQTYELEICYKKTSDAEKFSYFPGVQKRDDNTVVFSSRDYFEVLRVISFLC